MKSMSILTPHSSLHTPRNSLRKRQRCPCINPNSDDKQRLHRMYDQHKPEGMLVGHAIEDEHRLNGEVPGAGTVGSGHDDGEVGYHKGYQRTVHAQVGGEIEAEEGEVVMQEVHHPDAYGEEQIEW